MFQEREGRAWKIPKINENQLKNMEKKKGTDWKEAIWTQLQPWEEMKQHSKWNPCSSSEKICRVLPTGQTHSKHIYLKPSIGEMMIFAEKQVRSEQAFP